jgi:predicted nicotinamide N-methyase
MTASVLKCKLASEYDLADATYKIAGLSLTITSVADSYALLDKISPTEFVKDEQMPYWAEIWPSSFVLSEFLIETVGVSGKRCLELGAGIGISSVALRKSGASVVATDYAIESLSFIELNAIQNAVELDAKFEIKQLDWRNVRLSETFDMVCAADVLYERRNLLPILLAIDKLLKPDGAAYIADPRREIAKNFARLSEENGFAIQTESRPIQFGKKHLEIDIYKLRKS